VSGRTVAALWTAAGRGAIATVRVALEFPASPLIDALPFCAANGRALSAQPIGRVVFGHWGGAAREEVVIGTVDQRSLEIHCHGGHAAAERILRDLAAVGCDVVSWAEALGRTESPLRAEILAGMCRATTLPTAALHWEQANGVFEANVRALMAATENDLAQAASKIRAWLAWADFGRHLTLPWRVVVAGRPNVGKSSLINAILGYTRCVVFDQPGTTRDVVHASTAIDGWPIELSDTAGLRASADPLESAGIARARAAVDRADLVIVLIDISQPASEADRAILNELPRALVVAHKCDLPVYDGADRWTPQDLAAWLRVSSKTGEGVESLVSAISKTLVPETPPATAVLPVTERQIAHLQRGLDAAERSDVVALRRALDDLVAGASRPPTDQDSAANRKGSPATS
jgi:tRNA modification GTPase